MPHRRLLIEGWRFIHHSYALVAQAHCLSLLKRGDLDLRFRDLPFHSAMWKATPGIFTPEQERVLAQIAAPEPGFAPDATFSMRPERPDFSAPASGRKLVFGTAEFRVLGAEGRGGLSSAAEVADTVSAVTPSRWAAFAFERFGLPPERIHVVPHGIDPSVMHPDPEDRLKMRNTLGVQNDFVFVAVGAMTWNKGLDLLLTAFARVAETEPDVRLLLKGVDGLYPSRQLVNEVLDDLPAKARATIAGRLTYEGRTISAQGMAHLLRGADCYVSPYRAEGFNMPVLEAMACGLPVLCTAGGPTDEFTEESFAGRIRSMLIRKRLSETETGDALAPDPEHLIELMRDTARNRDTSREAGLRAARHALENFTWDGVTERLLASLLPTSG